ncbi:MAG: hypothetical protein HY775_07845 [Acidobacteria bacterium]|nr:hypothetical protein [Acidobacteriota bacterium]
MTARRRLTVVVAAGLLFGALSGASPGLACTCAAETGARQMSRASAVFTGRVARVVAEDPGTGTVVAEIQVEAVYKGDPGLLAFVRTAGSEEACGVGFVEGHRYLVYASGGPRVLAATVCGGTTADVGALDRAGRMRLATYRRDPRPTSGGAPGPAAAPPRSPGAPSRAVPIGTGAALAAGVTMGLAARARRRRGGQAGGPRSPRKGSLRPNR